jgi:hypothetical protein
MHRGLDLGQGPGLAQGREHDGSHGL